MNSSRAVPRVALVLIAGVLWAAAACVAGRRGPPLPDLSDPVARVDARAERIRRIREVILRDLDRLATLQNELADLPAVLLAPPFPRDRFRHIAMRCLTATPPTTASSDDRSEAPAAVENQLECAPDYYDRLVDELRERAPDRVDRAVGVLEQVDEFYRLRSRLGRRLSKTVAVVESTNNLLANHRAELANRRSELDQKRNEYPTGRYQTAQTRLDAYERALDDLQEMTTELLASAETEWPRRLETTNRNMYDTISDSWGSAYPSPSD